jgi:hypothetical protein
MLEEWDNGDMVYLSYHHSPDTVFDGSGNKHLHADQGPKSERSMYETVKISAFLAGCVIHNSRFGQTGSSRDCPLMSWDLHGMAVPQGLNERRVPKLN